MKVAALSALALCVTLVPSLTHGQARWPSEGPPRPLAAREVTFPPYELRTLPNGLQVVAVLHHEQPVVSMRMIVRAGAAMDPPAKAGLANIAASLLDQGTTTQSAGEVNDAIDFIGGAMGAGAGTDLTFVNVLVMKDSFETGLRMLSDMARRPAFAPIEIERQRQQVLSGLQVSFEDPEFVANAVFDRLVYGFHPYGLPQLGTPDTLASITRDDIVAYHARNFVPNNAILAIVGDVTAEDAFAGVTKVFGDWARRDIVRPAPVAPPEPTRRVIVINKPDAVQTEIRAGHLGVKRNTSDFMSLNLALRILGGEGANRLHQVLRTERALTYGAKADMHTLLDAGDFEASTNTRSAATGETLRLLVDEFWRLQRDRVRERELTDVKAYMTGSFPLTIETPDAIATQVLNVLFFGLPVEELTTYRARVNAVQPDDIERVARYYLRPDRLSIVLVGNAQAFSTQLRGLGFNNVEVIEMTDLDLMAANFKRSGRPSPRPAAAIRLAPADAPRVAYAPAYAGGVAAASAAVQTPSRTMPPPQDAAPARTLLASIIAAKGGVERLRGVKTIKATTSATQLAPSSPSDGPTTLESVTYIEYPSRVRVETHGPDAEMVQVFDGTRAWIKNLEDVYDVPERMVRDLQASLKRDVIALLLAADDGRVRMRLLPDTKDEAGRPLRALEFSGAGVDPVVLYADSATSHVAKLTYVSGGIGGALVEELYSDYRPVDGIQIAYEARVRIRGEAALARRVTAITINEPFDPSLFIRPPS